jgi:hypothetical protein
MSIVITLLGAAIWCVIVYLVLKWFGYCTKDDEE